jgi:cellulose synthase/poly-beta-1,6-N-acetylglucosamine synthase-like glycosyltransferase
VSQYRNLLHHYVHQNGKTDASTFWTGCGAIRRSAFDAMQGFDPTAIVDDIDMGYRLKSAGYRILLDRSLLCSHLKSWTLRSMLETDIRLRALPWSRLILQRGILPNDLNLRMDQRVSACLVMLAVVCLLLSQSLAAVALSSACLGGVLFLNRRLYRFFLAHRGPRFLAAALLLHLTYLLCSFVCFVAAWATHAPQQPASIAK